MGQEEIPRQLLRDRAAPLLGAARDDVRDQGARETDGIDPPVGIETPVLDREDRLDQRARDVLERNERAVLLEELVHQLLVPVVHERLDRRSDGLEIGRGREVLPKPVRNADTDPNDPAEQDHQDREQTFRDASPAWTHDEDLVPFSAAAMQECIDAFEQLRSVEPLTINEALQSLPSKLAFGQ